MVVLADRDPAADRDEVGIERPGERLVGGLEGVTDDPRAGELGPRADGEPGEGERVRVADPSRGQGLAWGLELIARGQHRHPRPSRAFDLGTADRGDHTGLGGADLGSRSQNRLPRPDVLPGAAYVPARLDRGPDLDGLPTAVGVLDPDHGVGAGGQHRAGRDRDRLAGAEPASRRVTGPRLVDDRQRDRGRGGVGGAHRVAVHRGVVETGDGVGADDVLSEGPAERFGDRDGLRAERGHALEHQPAGRVDLERGCGHFRQEANPVRDWVDETAGDGGRGVSGRSEPPHGRAEGDG